jgi:hypothetical protein
LKIKIVEVDENIDTKTENFMQKLRAISALYEASYILEPTCDKCGKTNLWNDFRRKISREVNDNAIECQWCGRRWVPILTIITNDKKMSFSLMTPSQITNMIGQYKNFRLAEIKQHNPALYHWSIIHFGCIRNAFRKAGIRYTKENAWKNWKLDLEKIYSQVENLSEYVLSDLLGISHCHLHSFNKNK